MPDADHPGYQQTLKKWSLPDLVACLGGHNADSRRACGTWAISSRAFRQLCRRTACATSPRWTRSSHRGRPRRHDRDHLQEAPNTPMHRRGFTSRDYVTSMVETTETTTRSLGAAATTSACTGAARGCSAYLLRLAVNAHGRGVRGRAGTTDDGVEHAVVRGAVPTSSAPARRRVRVVRPPRHCRVQRLGRQPAQSRPGEERGVGPR